jgi:PAS domain S-box-containing protein
MMFICSQLFFDKNFISSGYIYFGKLGIIRFGIVSKLIVSLSYLIISLLLLYVLRHRPNIPYQKIFWLFFAPIAICGATHLLELFALWYPNYRLSSLFNAIAAGITLYIVGKLAYLMPKVLALPNLIAPETVNESAVTEQKQAEAAQRESEERFRSLVAHIPGVVYRCACDANRTAEFISDVIKEISGYPAADFLHNQVRTFASVIAPDDRARVERIVSKRVAQRRPYVLEYRIVREDGTVRWVYEKGQGVFAADGSLVCVDGVLFDITEYKQTQEELRLREEQFRQLTENINEVFFLTAPDASKILYISPAYEDVWGRSTKTLYAQPNSWLDSVHLDDRDRIVAALTRHIQDLQDFVEEYRVVRPDGSVRWVWVRAVHILNPAGSSERIAGIAEDITERKLAEVEILNALAKEKELGDLKSRFISITSHEFRTPLATIMSTAELLEYYQWTKQEEVEQLHLIQEAVKHMLELLNDLLFIGTAEAGQVRLNPEPLLLNEFCQELVAQIQRGIGVNLTNSGFGYAVTFASQGESFLACTVYLLTQKSKHQLKTQAK